MARGVEVAADEACASVFRNACQDAGAAGCRIGPWNGRPGDFHQIGGRDRVADRRIVRQNRRGRLVRDRRGRERAVDFLATEKIKTDTAGQCNGNKAGGKDIDNR